MEILRSVIVEIRIESNKRSESIELNFEDEESVEEFAERAAQVIREVLES